MNLAADDGLGVRHRDAHRGAAVLRRRRPGRPWRRFRRSSTRRPSRRRGATAARPPLPGLDGTARAAGQVQPARRVADAALRLARLFRSTGRAVVVLHRAADVRAAVQRREDGDARLVGLVEEARDDLRVGRRGLRCFGAAAPSGPASARAPCRSTSRSTWARRRSRRAAARSSATMSSRPAVMSSLTTGSIQSLYIAPTRPKCSRKLNAAMMVRFQSIWLARPPLTESGSCGRGCTGGGATNWKRNVVSPMTILPRASSVRRTW